MNLRRWVLLGLIWTATLAGAFVTGVVVHKYRSQIRARLFSLQSSPVVQTNLYNLRIQKLAIPGEGRDGALEVLGNGLLLANRRGQLWFVDSTRQLHDLPLRVPINLAEFEADTFNRHTTDQDRFSVKDLLVRNRAGRMRIFASHFQWHADRHCNDLHVSMLESTVDSVLAGLTGAGRWRGVFESAPCRDLIETGDGRTKHVTLGSGGRMVALSDRQLLVTVSEFSAEYQSAPSADSSALDSYGKTILVDLETGRASEYSRGHRNAQGLAIGPDGRVWETEHGARGGDELNLILPGRHYGAPLVTYGTQYEMMTWPLSKTQGRHEGFEKPVFAWVPSIATSQLLVLRGSAFPWWSGDLLVSTLGSLSLFRVRVEDERVRFVEPIMIGHRIRDVVEMLSGTIALKTDDDFLVFVDNLDRTPTAMLPAAVRGELVAGQCKSCHTFEQNGASGIGPNLWGIEGRRVAYQADYAYSDALRRMGGTWTAARLRAFVANPQVVVPGTKMQTTSTYTEEQLTDLMAYLRSLR